MFAFRHARGQVELAFTDRHGGVSGGPFASLNLAARPEDGADADAVRRNLELVTTAFTGPTTPEGSAAGPARSVVAMRQVHGDGVHVVDEEHLTRAQPAPVADALVTTVPGVVLLVRVADCVPVVLADERAGVVAAVHAGRPGLVAGVVPRTVETMRALGAAEITAWLGPHVCGACYEVPDRMRAEVAAVAPAAHATTSWGTPAVDVGAGVLEQLAAAGVAATDVARCTIEDPDLFSYRRQGPRSGRLGGLVWLRP